MNIDRYTLFLWLSKIFYGLLFKEILLPFDRADLNDNRLILPHDAFERFSMAHIFLQGARVPITLREFVPWSIFIFEAQTSSKKDLNFDFRDSFIDITFGIRMGKIAIVSVLQDNGAQAAVMGDYIRELQTLRLHPVQFGELFAKTTYKQRLLNRVPKYMIIEAGDQVEIIAPPLQGLSGKPIYDDWDPKAYAHHLAFHVSQSPENLFLPPDNVMTWLHNEDGSLKVFTEDQDFN